MKAVNVEDLLGRDPIKVDVEIALGRGQRVGLGPEVGQRGLEILDLPFGLVALRLGLRVVNLINTASADYPLSSPPTWIQ